ncbi:VOC family protein [Bacillus solimangrovi]|uniref:VOC domain-containing protein n=1 Tax=Bacillus solimangrovi TaxID=1305675 RepID=A0A1E5LHJ0_9BACI|nr:VOC family protein [Bacillus solimangrovi]OEH93554.1 hypothetical protein BFG57_00770 [Bacillus solimangrovi]
MKINEITLKSFNFNEMKQFYTNVLQMQLITEEDNLFSVKAGKTMLTFERSSHIPFYHFCLRTNDSYFDHMYERIKVLHILLPNESGETLLFWEGKQAYFTDPDGNILEMLVRPFLYDEQEPFGWFDIGEVGMPSKSVKELQNLFASFVTDEMKHISDTFAFYGDEFGVFVLVKEGRHWYPTERPATIHPIKIAINGVNFHRWEHPSLPYTISNNGC